MSKFNKVIIWTFVVFLSIAIVLGLVWLVVPSIIPPDVEKTEEYFQQDKDDLSVIADYLSKLDYSLVSIDKTCLKKGIMFTGAYTRYQKIDDETVLEALKNILYNRKYKEVGKSSNTVYFRKWVFLEQNRGIAVPVNKETAPSLQYLIESKELSENGWYYYEANYEEYRNRRTAIAFAD